MKVTRKRHRKRHNKTKTKRHNKTKTKRHTKCRAGGSKIYTNYGKIEKLNECHKGTEIFRKMTNNVLELEISKIIMENPHKNIVTIYKIVEPKDAADKNGYIDMELLNTDISKYNKNEIKEKMKDVKKHLQGLGIMYIDWKPDNIGLGDGELKLFDFDVSGLVNKDQKEHWVEKGTPRKFWAYQNALLDNKDKTPLEIDNYAFDHGLK